MSERELIKNGRSDRERIALRKALPGHDHPVELGTIPISVLTIHASKGQEAADVAIYDGITTTIKKGMRDDEETRKNEWRTWYVALTRASERLHIMRGGFDWAYPIIPDNIRAMATNGDEGGRGRGGEQA